MTDPNKRVITLEYPTSKHATIQLEKIMPVAFSCRLCYTDYRVCEDVYTTWM